MHRQWRFQPRSCVDLRENGFCATAQASYVRRYGFHGGLYYRPMVFYSRTTNKQSFSKMSDRARQGTVLPTTCRKPYPGHGTTSSSVSLLLNFWSPTTFLSSFDGGMHVMCVTACRRILWICRLNFSLNYCSNFTNYTLVFDLLCCSIFWTNISCVLLWF